MGFDFRDISSLFSRCGYLRAYGSRLGFKIAVIVGVFIVMPMLGHLLFHEYRQGGMDEIYALLKTPSLWIILTFSFLVLMAVLSKVVILPIKRFEMHISELESGVKKEPFALDSNDEIGFLAGRFNSLQKIVTSEIESRDIQLSVLNNFTNATSGIFDIPTLMDSFFTILGTFVEFDIGAYVFSCKNHTEGRIYSTFDLLEEGEAEKITKGMVSRAANYAPAISSDKISRLDVHIIRGNGIKPSPKDIPIHFVDLPLVCFGEAVGIISLISYSSAGTDPIMGSKVFNSMARHASTVIERLLNHIVAEERRLANILSSMSEGVYLIDRNGHAMSINKKGMELVSVFCKYSLECARNDCKGGIGNCPEGNRWEACEFSNVISKVRKFGTGFEGKVHTEEIRNREGLVIHLSISELQNESGAKEGYVITAKDVTEDRLIQKRVMLSSKLAALGEMAAGIAHEVNNPLQVMMANIELLEATVGEKSLKRLDHLKDGILRIKGIVKDLLIFAREQTTEVEDININSVIEKVVDILGNQLRTAGVDIGLDLDRRALIVRCNRNLFQQVIINLLQNAKDAIEESKKGSKVSIRTVLLPGGIVVVEVVDDGPGIPENILDRVFDPFFTTKDIGKGTGLGLSVSRRIIEGMGGNITVASSGYGTAFTITLLHNRAARKKESRKEDGGHDYSKLAGKSVIIVDDEEGVLKAVKESIGSKVADMTCSTKGEHALQMMMDGDYDLVLLDIKMPGMNGMELYKNLNETKPYLAERVIFLTGDTENEATESFIKLTGCRYLSKPFTMKELLNIMCENEPEMERQP